MRPGSIHTAEIFDSPWPGLFGTRIESDRHFGKHSHATFGLGLIERGAQSSASGRGPVEACAGDVITCNPGEVHDGHPIGGHSRRWRMVYAEPEVFAALAGTASVPDVSRVELTRPVTSDTRSVHAVRSLFDGLDDWLACGDRRTVGSESLACEESFVRASALLLGRPAKPIGRGDVPIEIRRSHDRIASDLLAPPSLTELAVASGLSKYQLLRRFEASYGLPPHRWLLQRRVEVARGLIAGGASLVEAAAISGFADQSHLTRHFTSQLGFTPGAWRNAMLQ
jgi:AraC-like DNA-binding protein